MGADYFAGMLLNPVVAAFFLVVIAGISSIHYLRNGGAPVVPANRLLPAYACALLACAVASAVMSYVSPEEALLKWKVPPENYWNAELNEFFTTYAFAAYASLLGIATVGLPVIIHLGRRGLATIPVVLAAATVISLLLAALMSVGDSPPFRHFGALAKELVYGHLLVAMAFCLGAGLPWRRRNVRT